MHSLFLTAAGAALAIALPAAAQTTSSPQTGPQTGQQLSSNSAMNSHSGMNSGQATPSAGQNALMTRQKVKQDLEASGFRNVHVMPQSFLVRAQDKEGRQVMMIINPDQITAVTAMTRTPGSTGGTGSGGAAQAPGASHSGGTAMGMPQTGSAPAGSGGNSGTAK